MKRGRLYQCGVEDLWSRQTGETCPRSFSLRMGGCEDLIKRLKLSVKLERHRGCVNTVHFNPSGELLVSGSDDLQIIIWDWAAKQKKLTFSSGHTNNVFQARVMPFTDDKKIVSCAADGQVRYCQIREDGIVDTKKIGEHLNRAHKLAIEPGSPNVFFSCGEDGLVQCFDLRTEHATKVLTCHECLEVKSESARVLRLNAIVIDPRSPFYFAVGGSDQYARVYDIRKCQWNDSAQFTEPVHLFSPSHLINNNNVSITGLAYSHQGELLASYNDELIYLFRKEMDLGENPFSSSKSENVEKPQVFEGHRNYRTVKGVSFFGSNTEYVVSGSDCGWIYIWRKKDGQLVHMMHGDKHVVNCLEPHPYAPILATSGIEKNIKIFEPVAEKLLPLPENSGQVMRTNKERRKGARAMASIHLPEMLVEMFSFGSHWSDIEENSGDSRSESDYSGYGFPGYTSYTSTDEDDVNSDDNGDVVDDDNDSIDDGASCDYSENKSHEDH